MVGRINQTAVALVAVLLVASSAGVAAGATSNSTATTTVIAVGESPEALLAANAIANANDYSVVRVPSDGLTPQGTQTLTDRKTHGDLNRAIVVGSTISTVVNEVQSLDVSVVDQIEAKSSGQLFHDASVQQWDSADAAFVTSNSTSDYRKVAVALTNDSVDDVPVLSETEYSGVLDYLGVSTVYVAPDVSQETRDALNDSYNVETAPANVSLEQSLQEVAGDYASDSENVAVSSPRNVLIAAQYGAMDSASLAVVENESTFDSEAKTTLQTQSNNTTTYVVGSGVPTSEVTDAAPGTVWTLQDYPELRSHLAVTDYEYGVLVSSVDKISTGKYDIDVTNIGFSDVPSPEGEPITLRWEGDILGSEPDGTQTDDGYVVAQNASMSPGDSFQVRLEASSLSNGGHPYLGYYVETSSGGLLNSGSTDLGLPSDSNIPSWEAIAVVVLAITVIGSAVYGVVQTNRPRTSSSRTTQTFRASIGLSSILRVFAFGVAIILAIPSDPITDTAGLTMVAALFLDYAFDKDE